jgi:hypothetical protein
MFTGGGIGALRQTRPVVAISSKLLDLGVNEVVPYFTAAQTNISYSPASNSQQHMKVWYPKRATPSGGFGGVLEVIASGYLGPAFSAMSNTITPADGLPYLALTLGLAWARCSVTYPGLSGAVGFGCNLPSIGATAATFAANDIGDKDACLALQYLHRNAGSLNLNAAKWGIKGRSEGGIHALFSGLGIDRVGTSGFWSTGSSRPAFCIAHAACSWWLMYNQGSFSGGPIPSLAFYDSTDAAFTGSPVPATLGNVLTGHKSNASVMKYGFDTANYPGVDVLNKSMPVYLHGSSPTAGVETTNFNDGNSTGAYDGAFANGTVTDMHSAVFAYTLMKGLKELDNTFHTANSRLVVTPNVYSPTYIPAADSVVGADGANGGEQQMDELYWILKRAA